MPSPATFSEDTLLLIGYLQGAHGVRGAVHAHLDDPALADYLAGKSLTLRPSRRIQRPVTQDVHSRLVTTIHHADRTHFLVTLEGVSDRTQAEALKGFELWMSRQDYPETLENQDSVRLADLIGFTVRPHGIAEPVAVGRVNGFFESGEQAQTFLEVIPLDTKGRPQLIPFNETMIPHIDLTGRVLDIPPHIAEWLQGEWRGDEAQQGETP
jgi:16S rRNA processing protein RimM